MTEPAAPESGRRPDRAFFARLNALDYAALRWIQAHRRPALTRILFGLSWSGSAIGWMAVCVALALWGVFSPAQRSAAAALLAAAAASGSAAVAGNLLKRAFRRPRPWLTLPDLRPHARPMERWSFPSSHAATGFAFVTVLFGVGHPLALPVALWAGLVTLSRPYLALHYLTDVLAGVALGVAIGAPFARLAWPALSEWLVGGPFTWFD
jgi:undecaprenyl-diphosphatase